MLIPIPVLGIGTYIDAVIGIGTDLISVLRPELSMVLVLVKYVLRPRHRHQLYMCAYDNFVKCVLKLCLCCSETCDRRPMFLKNILKNVVQMTEHLWKINIYIYIYISK